MKLWRLTPERAAEWRAIRLEALRLAPDSYGSRLSNWQDRPLADFAARLAAVPTFAAGETEGDPLAVAAWERDTDLPQRAWLLSVYARPAARGRGYTAALITHICAEAAAAGCTELALSVGTANAPAQALYARLGFQRTGAPAWLNDNGVPEVDMRLALGAAG